MQFNYNNNKSNIYSEDGIILRSTCRIVYVQNDSDVSVWVTNVSCCFFSGRFALLFWRDPNYIKIYVSTATVILFFFFVLR